MYNIFQSVAVDSTDVAMSLVIYLLVMWMHCGEICGQIMLFLGTGFSSASTT